MPSHQVHPPDWIDGAPIVVSKSVDIAATPSDVWAHVADHEAWPEWFTPIDRAEVKGAASGVGGGRCVHVGRMQLDECFTAWDEAEHFAFAVTSSPIPILDWLVESVVLEAIDGGGTRVTYRQGLRGRRGMGWMMKLAWRRMPGQLEESLLNLCRRAESP